MTLLNTTIIDIHQCLLDRRTGVHFIIPSRLIIPIQTVEGIPVQRIAALGTLFVGTIDTSGRDGIEFVITQIFIGILGFNGTFLVLE